MSAADRPERMHAAVVDALRAQTRWLWSCLARLLASDSRVTVAALTRALEARRVASAVLRATEPDAFDLAGWLAGPHGAVTHEALVEHVADLEADLAAAREALAHVAAVPAPTAAHERS